MSIVVSVDNAPFTHIKESAISGLGLFASKPLKKGDIVVDDNPFIGRYYKRKWEDLTPEQCNKNWLLPLDEKYCMTMDYSNKLHYINHSRNPNCEWQIKKLTVIANRDIQQNEELFVDYRLEYRPNRSKYPEWI
jgi:SET domain-containing protein